MGRCRKDCRPRLVRIVRWLFLKVLLVIHASGPVDPKDSAKAVSIKLSLKAPALKRTTVSEEEQRRPERRQVVDTVADRS
jgi:hypothetical protein